MGNASKSGRKKTTRTKARPVKPVAQTPAKPLKDLTDKKNALGRSNSFDAAIDASVELVSYHYHRLLSKYHTDGKILDQIVIPGQEGDGKITIDPADALAQDLVRVQNMSLLVNNMQRIRSDDALDITKNPMD